MSQVIRDQTFGNHARFCWNEKCNYLVSMDRKSCLKCGWSKDGPPGFKKEKFQVEAINVVPGEQVGQMENWKPCPFYEHTHEVSDLGQVRGIERTVPTKGNSTRRIRSRIIKQNAHHKTGVMSVQLSHRGKTISVHRLVALAFHPNPNGHPHINHIDGSRANNAAANLEWCSPSHNQLHAYRTGLQRPKGQKLGEHHRAKKIVVKRLDGTEVGRYDCIMSAAIDMGLRDGSIRRVLRGSRRMYRSMTFHYL